MTTNIPAVYDHANVDDIPVVEGSARPLVLPKAGEPVVAVPIRPGVTLCKEGAWWDGHETAQNTFIMGSDPDDIYPNDETLEFYEVVPDATVEDYNLGVTAATILSATDHWNFTGSPVVMTKTRGVELIGLAAGPGQLQTAEGLVDFAEGDAIVRSPDRTDRVWRIEPAIFTKKYDLA